MDDSALRRLSRTQIQGLARRENIKANQKTNCIIQSLIQKYPGGVPRISLSPKKRGKLVVRIRGQLTATFPIKSEESEEAHVRQVLDQRTVEVPPQRSPLHDSCTVADSILALTDSLPNPVESADALALLKNKKGPSIKDLRLVLRELTKLVNTGLDIQEDIHEAEILLTKTRKLVKEVEKDMKEVVWTRFCMEEDFVKPLKEDRTLWDGTRLMKGEGRQRWEDYMAKQNEAHAQQDRLREKREKAQKAQEMDVNPSLAEEEISASCEELPSRKRSSAQEPEIGRPRKRSRP